MTRIIIIAAASLLAGCGTLDRVMENRVACSLDRSQGAFISWYGPVGISAKIAEAEAKATATGEVPIDIKPVDEEPLSGRSSGRGKTSRGGEARRSSQTSRGTSAQGSR